MRFTTTRCQGLRPRQLQGHLGRGAHAVHSRPGDRRGRLAPEPAPLGRRPRHRRRVRLRQAGRVLLDVGAGAQAHLRASRSTRSAARRTIMSCSDQNMDVVIELARHAKAIGADYIVVHAPVLHFLHEQDETLYEYYRHISEQVEIGIALWSHPGQRLPDEPGAVRAHRRAAERGRHQVQRAARDVCAAHAACRRQDPGEHGLRRGMVRQHRRARLAALSLLVAALSRCRPRPTGACANTPTSRSRGEIGARQGGARQPQSGARGVPPHAAAGEIPFAFEILAGTARPGRAARCAGRCWS